MLLLSLAVPTASAQSQGTDETRIQNVLKRFFAGIRASDADAAAGTWIPESPHYAAIRAAIVDVIARKAAETWSACEVTTIRVLDDRAIATLRFRGKWSKADEQFDDEEFTAWRAELRRDSKGNWRIWTAQHQMTVLLELLEVAPNADVRRSLYRAHPDLVGKRLLDHVETLAEACMDKDEIDAATRCFEVAVEVATLLKNEHQVAENLLGLGAAHMCAARPAEALIVFERALKVAQHAKSTDLETHIRNGLATALTDLGQTAEAIRQLEASLATSHPLDPSGAYAIAQNMMGFAHYRRGNPIDALRWFQASLESAEKIERADLQMQALSHLAPTLRDAGDLGAAYRACLEGLAMAKQVASPVIEAKLQNTLGLVHRDTGDYGNAIGCYARAIDLWEGVGYSRFTALGLSNLGDAMQAIGLHDDAVRAYEKSLRIASTLDHEVGLVTNAHNNLGIVARLRGRFDEAKHHYQLGLDAAERRDYVTGRIFSICNLAEIDFARHRYDDAIDGFRRALTITKESGAIQGSYHANLGIGASLARRNKAGDLEAAAVALREAIASVESNRSSLEDPMMKLGFFANSTQAYFDLADVLIRLGRDDAAFRASEQAKARVIVEMLHDGRVHVVKEMSADEEAEELKLKSRVSALTTQLDTTYLTDTRDEIAAEIRDTRARLEAFRKRVFERSPRLKTLRGEFDAASLQSIQESLFSDAPEQHILSYVVGPDETLLFEISPGPERARVVTHRIPCSERILRERIDELWSQCSVATTPYQDSARALYELLLAPVAKKIRSGSHVALVPSGVLHRLPFHVLLDADGKHFIETNSVSYAPSVTALLEMHRLRRRLEAQRAAQTAKPLTPILAIGAPKMPPGYSDLPEAVSEIETVARSFGGLDLHGEAASESATKSSMPHARRIHFATHGTLNERRPMDSFLVLGRDDVEDGRLHANEISKLDLQAELVVLSACDSGRGKEVRGEGTIGLTWSLLVAGVPTHVVSQWQVHDKATRELMLRFYDSMQRDAVRVGPAQALQRAQRACLETPSRSHPYFWAPFSVVGAWR